MQSTISENAFLHIEMLSIEQFAARMGVGRTTVYDWFKSGKLRAGRHYIKLGGTARIPWGHDLLQKLFEDSLEQEKPASPQINQIPANILPPAPATERRKLQINMDY